MTAKELITILKRFPKDAQITINGTANPKFNATCDIDDNWTLDLSEGEEEDLKSDDRQSQ